MVSAVSEPDEIARRDRLVDQIFQAALGGFDLAALYLGERLGLYRAPEADGPLTSTALAAGEGLNERFVREWLEQQAVSGILDVEDADRGPTARRYRLPAAHAEVLHHPEPGPHRAPREGRRLDADAALLEAYRTGQGCPGALRRRHARGRAAGNRRSSWPCWDQWLPAIPDVHARLRAQPAARVADVACGAGWSTIAMAQACQTARIEEFDLDGASSRSPGGTPSRRVSPTGHLRHARRGRPVGRRPLRPRDRIRGDPDMTRPSRRSRRCGDARPGRDHGGHGRASRRAVHRTR
jgi:hypothetical protein